MSDLEKALAGQADAFKSLSDTIRQLNEAVVQLAAKVLDEESNKKQKGLPDTFVRPPMEAYSFFLGEQAPKMMREMFADPPTGHEPINELNATLREMWNTGDMSKYHNQAIRDKLRYWNELRKTVYGEEALWNEIRNKS